MLQRNHMKSINNLTDQQKNVIENLENFKNLSSPFYVCVTYCLDDLKKNEIPRYSSLNNIFLYDSPNEILNLNTFEQILIQLAKSFLTIVKLKTFSNTTNQSLLPALKGIIKLVQIKKYF